MSDLLNSIVGSVYGSIKADSPVAQTKTDREKAFVNMLAEAEAKRTVEEAPTQAAKETAVEKFMKYQKMSAAEKFRASYLAEKGLTEEDVAKMEPEERARLEKEIATRIRERMHAKELKTQNAG